MFAIGANIITKFIKNNGSFLYQPITQCSVVWHNSTLMLITYIITCTVYMISDNIASYTTNKVHPFQHFQWYARSACIVTFHSNNFGAHLHPPIGLRMKRKPTNGESLRLLCIISLLSQSDTQVNTTLKTQTGAWLLKHGSFTPGFDSFAPLWIQHSTRTLICT